jgi:membrane associated rhomboid family serine protease
VGFQCPDCVAQSHQGARTGAGPRSPARRSRPAFLGRVSARDGLISIILMGVCVVAWIIQLASSAFTERFQLVGITLTSSGELGGVAGGEWWRLITAAFLHADTPIHILFNMYALYLFGPPLESAFGRLRFLALYLLSALGGCVASYAFSSPIQPSLGASGAIFGLFGAALVVSRRIGLDRTALWVLLGLNVAIGFVMTGIDWRAHLGGLATGAAVAAIFAYVPARPPRRRDVLQAVGCALVFVLLAGGAMARTNQLAGDPITRLACANALDADSHRVCER